MLNRFVAGLAGLLALITVSASGVAAPLSPHPQGSETANTLVQKVHGCHQRRRAGRYGWHRHVGPFCERVRARSPRYRRYRGERRRYRDRRYRDRRYRDRRYRDRRYRGDRRCRTVRKCKYIGPIKTCKRRRVCDY